MTLRPPLVALLAAIVGLGIPGAAGPAHAADERPREVPFDRGGIPQLNPDYDMSHHKVVLITDGSLNPRLVTLEQGQLVAWISYSASPSVVVFERDVARSMICHSLVNFSIVDDELRSAPIQAGEFASFCELQPGRYRYKVLRPEAGKRSSDATQRLEGEIVVGNP